MAEFMFGSGPSGKKPSLLTLAKQQADDARHDNSENVISLDGNLDAVSKHRRARATRRVPKSNPLLKALGMQDKHDETSRPESNDHAEAVAAIERDVDALVSDQVTYDTANEQAHIVDNYADRPLSDNDAFKPLIDPITIIDAVWRWRWPIIGTTLLGGVLGAFIAVSTPQTYTAYSQVVIDPRQIKLIGRDLTPEFLGNESALAIVDSQLESIYSTPVLQRVVEKLSLDQDAEFNGTADSGIGFFDGIAFVRSLFSSETPVDTSDRVTLENLRQAIGAQRTSRTFVFTIRADSQNQRRAAEIANALTQAFIENQKSRESQAARDASSALGGQLTDLKQAVEDAERRAEEFAQSNNLARVDGLTLSDNKLVTTSNQLNEAQAATIRAKSLAQAAQAASVDQVVQGGLPPELINPALITFRAQFSSLSQNAASLEQALGPRHPRLANAIASRDAARDEIRAELQRIVAGTQADLRRAIQNEQQIAASLAQARSEKGQSGDALIKLRELESEIEAAQSIYKAALLRSRETDQLEQLVSVNTTVISEAEAPLYASSLSRKIVAVFGLVGGFLFGLGLAFIAGLRDCFNANRQASEKSPSPDDRPKNKINKRRPTSKPISNNFEDHAPAGSVLTAKKESNMYPAYQPYAPQPQMQQNVAYPHQPLAPQPMPQQMMQPQYAPQPQYAQQPMGYMQAPMQQPMQPMMQPQMVAVQMPAQPQYQQAAPQPVQPQPAPIHAAPVQTAHMQTPPAMSHDEQMEIEELRASVQEIRDVVDHLTQRRGARRQFG